MRFVEFVEQPAPQTLQITITAENIPPKIVNEKYISFWSLVILIKLNFDFFVTLKYNFPAGFTAVFRRPNENKHAYKRCKKTKFAM